MTDVRLRDQAFAALSELRRWQCDPKQHVTSGNNAKDMIISLLTIVSNDGDLQRIKQLIEHQGDQDYMIDHHNHPHIKRTVTEESTLQGVADRSHKQDARQQLVAILCEAVESGLISTNDLEDHHKTWLQHITPLIRALDYINYGNAGSREEIDAQRQSTLICAISALRGLERIQHTSGREFLRNGSGLRKDLLEVGTRRMTGMGLYESPNHNLTSLRHRKADAALLYRLVMDKQGELSALLQDTPTPREVIEWVINHLYDSTTGGIRRYLGDSYQQAGMYTKAVWHDGLLAHPRGEHQLSTTAGLRVDPIFRDATGILHYAGRNFLLQALQASIRQYAGSVESSMQRSVPSGKEAGRTHPHFQIASRAAREYIRLVTSEKNIPKTPGLPLNNKEIGQLYTLATDAFNRGIAMITGTDEYTVRPNSHTSTMEIQQVGSRLVPECRLYHTNENGDTITTPGPWTPLFRGVACLREASAYMQKMISLHNQSQTKV